MDTALNSRGMTELHLAAYYGDLTWVQNCLKGGLSLHTRDKGGYTPLHWAVDMGMAAGEREAVVSCLLEAGADVYAEDGLQRTVLALAKEAGNEDIVRILEAAIASERCKER